MCVCYVCTGEVLDDEDDLGGMESPISQQLREVGEGYMEEDGGFHEDYPFGEFDEGEDEEEPAPATSQTKKEVSAIRLNNS